MLLDSAKLNWVCYHDILTVVTELSSHFLMSAWDGRKNLPIAWCTICFLFVTHKEAHNFIRR